MTTRFLSKARTLETLEGRLARGRVLPQVRFSVAEFRAEPERVLLSILEKGWTSVAVRSSAATEDGGEQSLAGRYESVLGVAPAGLAAAVADVAASMTGADASEDDEVFVQPMVSGVALAGVAFGFDPSTGGPYYVVNYDDTTGTTDAVTAGRSNDLRTVYIHRSAPTDVPELNGLLALLRELEEIFGTVALDVEFALTDTGEWVVLQVRPLVGSGAPVTAERHREILDVVATKVARASHPQPFLCGRKAVFGVMPDWNPAEIIGIRPKPLALSLYRDLVTDSIWAYQRHNYGYRNLRSFPLMLHFHGLPYIDVRVSFNSFIPRDIDEALADKLVNYYIDRLLEDPSRHDKVEFEIVFSCYTLDLPERVAQLADYGFTADERQTLIESLRALTNRIVDNQSGLWRSDRDKIDVLEARHRHLLDADLDRVSRIYWLLEDCKRYGTLPFAGLARAGFIAVQMLRSLVDVGVLTARERDAFMNGLTTVSGQLARDMTQLDRSTFLSKYGHLRPGTYDIESLRYDEAPDLYFDWSATSPQPEPAEPFALSLAQMRRITALLAEHGLSHDVVGLFDFLQAGIEEREYAKFAFSRNLSDALALFGEFGAEHGFSREELAYADIAVVHELYAAGLDPRDLLRECIERGRRRHEESLTLVLPPVIAAPDDVYAFAMPRLAPNFVTQKDVTAPIVSHVEVGRLGGSIVAIPSADPGFDWLFSHNIAGIVTAYGGVNSHMAIRAGELALPAVIGAGSVLYDRWSTAELLRIDCANRLVEVVR